MSKPKTPRASNTVIAMRLRELADAIVDNPDPIGGVHVFLEEQNGEWGTRAVFEPPPWLVAPPGAAVN